MNQNNSFSSQIIAQWIASIAVSVICCAILFVVFAGYIVDLKDAVNLMSFRLEVAQENQVQLLSEIKSLRKALEAQNVVPSPSPSAQAAPEMPPGPGVEIKESAPDDPDEKGSIAPVVGASAPNAGSEPPKEQVKEKTPPAPAAPSATPKAP